jgi:hypothetical protein
VIPTERSFQTHNVRPLMATPSWIEPKLASMAEEGLAPDAAAPRNRPRKHGRHASAERSNRAAQPSSPWESVQREPRMALVTSSRLHAFTRPMHSMHRQSDPAILTPEQALARFETCI